MDALDNAISWMAAATRTPPTFDRYLSALDNGELLSLSVGAQVLSDRSRETDPARSLFMRAVAATAADALDDRGHRPLAGWFSPVPARRGQRLGPELPWPLVLSEL